MIEWTITSSVLILVVLVLRRLLSGKISLRLQYILWALVLVRLLLPVSLGSTSMSVLNAVEGTQAQLPNPVLGYVGGAPPQLSVVEPDPSLSQEQWQEQYEENQAQMDAVRAEAGTPVSLGTVLLGVWAAGSVGLGLWLLWVNVRFGRKLCRSRSLLEMNCPLPVYVTGVAQTPCLLGLLRPCIYLTEEAVADEIVLRHSLAHELTHYRHKDHLWAALRGVCLALHWYNPLVWLAAVLSQRDGELCCDEATVRSLGEGERAAYGRTLLAVTCQGHGNPLLTATSMTGSGIKERIALLAKRPKTAFYTLIAVILIAAMAVGCTFTGAPKESALLEDAVLYELGDGLILAIPADIAEELVVEFPGGEHQEPRFPYVYHRASYEAGMEDFGDPAGFLFNLFREDQVGYEQTYLAADGGTGQVIFARDNQWYYGMGVPTDVQFYTGSDEIDTSSPEYQRWEYILSQITHIQADFADRNGLTLFDASADLDRPFLWEGEHRYVACRSADGSVSLTLLLSQPAKQGDGGIWCVEGSFENKYGVWNRELPTTQVPVAEYYADLQAQVDQGHRPSLLDPVQAAMDWYRTKYDTEDLSGVTFTLSEGEASGTLLTSADLDRDGEDEGIWLEEQPEDYYELVVNKQDGTELYREGARRDHIGWNSLYLYTDSQGQASLLRYNPYSSTGLSTYFYTLFSLEGGAPTVIQEGSLDFEIRQAEKRAEELIAFADEVNALLRRSSLLLSTQEGEVTIGPADRGEFLEHLSGVGDFLTEDELEAYRSAFWPEIMNGDQVSGVNPVSAFFTSYYERPEELNFEEFLRYLFCGELVEDDPYAPEFQALMAHPLWPFDGDLVPVPIRRYTRQTVDQVLEKYAGITTRDLSGVGMDTVLYLEEYDAWYNFTSDYGPGMFIPTYGLREGGIVTLWEQSSGNGTPGDALTLEETGDGFRILSHLPGQ